MLKSRFTGPEDAGTDTFLNYYFITITPDLQSSITNTITLKHVIFTITITHHYSLMSN